MSNEATGFTDVSLAEVDEPGSYGPDVAVALDWVCRFTCTSQTLNRLGPADEARAIRRLREALGQRGWVANNHAIVRDNCGGNPHQKPLAGTIDPTGDDWHRGRHGRGTHF